MTAARAVKGGWLLLVLALVQITLSSQAALNNAVSVNSGGGGAPPVTYLPPVPTKDAATYFPVGPVPYNAPVLSYKKPAPKIPVQKVFIPNPWIKGQCVGYAYCFPIWQPPVFAQPTLACPQGYSPVNYYGALKCFYQTVTCPAGYAPKVKTSLCCAVCPAGTQDVGDYCYTPPQNQCYASNSGCPDGYTQTTSCVPLAGIKSYAATPKAPAKTLALPSYANTPGVMSTWAPSVTTGNGYNSDFQGPLAKQNDIPGYDNSNSFLQPQNCTYTCCKASAPMAPKKCCPPNVSKQYVIPTVVCPPGCTLDKISGLCACSPGTWAPCSYGIPTCNCNGLPLCVTQTQFFGIDACSLFCPRYATLSNITCPPAGSVVPGPPLALQVASFVPAPPPPVVVKPKAAATAKPVVAAKPQPGFAKKPVVTAKPVAVVQKKGKKR